MQKHESSGKTALNIDWFKSFKYLRQARDFVATWLQIRLILRLPEVRINFTWFKNPPNRQRGH